MGRTPTDTDLGQRRQFRPGRVVAVFRDPRDRFVETSADANGDRTLTAAAWFIEKFRREAPYLNPIEQAAFWALERFRDRRGSASHQITRALATAQNLGIHSEESDRIRGIKRKPDARLKAKQREEARDLSGEERAFLASFRAGLRNTLGIPSTTRPRKLVSELGDALKRDTDLKSSEIAALTRALGLDSDALGVDGVDDPRADHDDPVRARVQRRLDRGRKVHIETAPPKIWRLKRTSSSPGTPGVSAFRERAASR